MNEIEARLDGLSDALAPLREAARRYLRYPSVLAADGTLCIGHRPWVAELNYMFRLYPGIPAETLGSYSGRFDLEVPRAYAAFLGEVGGTFSFGISLCGVPRSMLGAVPLLDRSVLQCHDLSTAARLWADEYRVPEGLFHFGSRHFSARENVGYFMDRVGAIRVVKRRGKVVGEWPDFTAFLAGELPVSEALEEALYPSQWPA